MNVDIFKLFFYFKNSLKCTKLPVPPWITDGFCRSIHSANYPLRQNKSCRPPPTQILHTHLNTILFLIIYSTHLKVWMVLSPHLLCASDCMIKDLYMLITSDITMQNILYVWRKHFLKIRCSWALVSKLLEKRYFFNTSSSSCICWKHQYNLPLIVCYPSITRA